MADLNKIRQAQMLAGENAVIAGLKAKGLIPEEEQPEGDKTKEQLTEEVEALVSALQQAEMDLKDQQAEHQDEIDALNKEIKELENEIADLEEKLEEPPDTSNLVDLMKHEKYVENFHKFSLEQFETFLLNLDLY